MHARPGGRHDRIEGRHGDALALRVIAPATGGKANTAIRRLLADAFDIALRDVTIVAGETARRKRIRLAGDPARLRRRLDELLDGR